MSSVSLKRKVDVNVQRVHIDGTYTKTQLVYRKPKTESGKQSIPLLEEVVEVLKEHRKRPLVEEIKAGSLYEGKENKKIKLTAWYSVQNSVNN